jgi:ADP-ribosylglycohydrolase
MFKEQYPKTFQSALRFKKYLQHPKYDIIPGTYSDDTQMSLGVANVLLKDKPYTKLQFADSWVDIYKKDPRDSYSRGFQAILDSIRDGEGGRELIFRLHPYSNKNGAAMRSVPIGILPTPEEVLEVSKLQAKITHDTPGGIFSSQAVALMSHFVLYEDRPLDRGILLEFLTAYLKGAVVFSKPWTWRVKPPQVGVNTAWAAFELIVSQKSLIGILRKTIELGGDTDSVASIAFGIASARLQDEKLPRFLFNNLENNSKFGRDFLIRLGKKLMNKYGV